MSRDPRRPAAPARAKANHGPEEVPNDVRAAWSAMETDEPPALLDQAVLNRARAAVAPTPTKRPWSFGWLHTATTAAVIVLGITLVLQLRDQVPGADDVSPVNAPATEAQNQMKSAPSPEASSVGALEEAMIESSDASGEDLEAAPQREALRMTPAPTTAPVNEEALGDFAPVLQAADAQRADDNEQSPGDSGSGEPGAEASRQRREMPAASPALQRSIESVQSAPESWLEEIRQLIADGDLERAAESLTEFRNAWPDYPIPEDLLP